MVQEYSISFKEVAVKLGGKNYTLRELDGKQRDDWIALVKKRKDGEGDRGLPEALLAMSLLDDTLKAVPVDVIQAWPVRVRDALYDTAEELLLPPKDEPLGNSQPASGLTGSASPPS